MAFGLSSALLVIGCGGPEYRPSASTEANQSQKPAPPPPAQTIEIAAGSKRSAENGATGTEAALNSACNDAIAAARAIAKQPTVPGSVARVGTAPAATTVTTVRTITCSDGKTYPLPTSVQPNVQPNVQSSAQPQQTRPVVQMPQQ